MKILSDKAKEHKDLFSLGFSAVAFVVSVISGCSNFNFSKRIENERKLEKKSAMQLRITGTCVDESQIKISVPPGFNLSEGMLFLPGSTNKPKGEQIDIHDDGRPIQLKRSLFGYCDELNKILHDLTAHSNRPLSHGKAIISIPVSLQLHYTTISEQMFITEGYRLRCNFIWETVNKVTKATLVPLSLIKSRGNPLNKKSTLTDYNQLMSPLWDETISEFKKRLKNHL